MLGESGTEFFFAGEIVIQRLGRDTQLVCDVLEAKICPQQRPGRFEDDIAAQFGRASSLVVLCFVFGVVLSLCLFLLFVCVCGVCVFVCFIFCYMYRCCNVLSDCFVCSLFIAQGEFAEFFEFSWSITHDSCSYVYSVAFEQ